MSNANLSSVDIVFFRFATCIFGIDFTNIRGKKAGDLLKRENYGPYNLTGNL